MTFLLLIVLTVIGLLVFAVWCSRHIMISRERDSGMVLDDNYSPGDVSSEGSSEGDNPTLHVFVAAKDEEDCIAKCVTSLLDQDYPNYRLTVINDRSDDSTGQIVQSLADEFDKLNLVNIEFLPDGWMGKNNAMQTGIAGSDSEWICMIDADCEQVSDKSLSTAVAYARDCGADMLSVLPEFEMHGFWENVLQPICSGVMMIWFRPDKVNNPQRTNAYANGAFMMIKRSVYEAIGTHQAVAGELNEDMQLALRTKSSGHSLRVVRGKGLYSLRMYTSLGETFRGWSRIFFGTFGSFKRLAVSFLAVGIVGLWPYLSAAVGWSVFSADGSLPALLCGISGVAGIIMQMSVISRFYRFIGGRWLLAWTYPFGCFMVLGMLMKSMNTLRKGAKVVWRGTSYTNPSVSK